MHPELITIPGVNLVIQSYGFMLVMAFIFGGILSRHNARRAGENPDHIANLMVYAMLGGVIGARVFHVIHFWDNYQDNYLDIIKIWKGGLEFLGGMIAATLAMLFYGFKNKLSIRNFMDIFAPALMLGLAFGRIGCFLNGCCYGKTCDLPWAVTFPAINDITELGPSGGATIRYSFPYYNQLTYDFYRDREPLVTLPGSYYKGYINKDGYYVEQLADLPAEYQSEFKPNPVPADELADKLVIPLRQGEYPMHKIHPTQLYSSLNGLVLCLILQWRFGLRNNRGITFSLMLILYGMARFMIEGVRADSPLEFTGLTISQNLSLLSIIGGMVMFGIFKKYPQVPVIQKETGDKNGKGKC